MNSPEDATDSRHPVAIDLALVHRTLKHFYLSPPSIPAGFEPETRKHYPSDMRRAAVMALEETGEENLGNSNLIQELASVAIGRVGIKRYEEIMLSHKEIAQQQNQRLAEQRLTPEG